MERQEILKRAIDAIDIVCNKMLQHEEYQLEMQCCIKEVSDSCILLLQENPDSRDILTILEDIMYGMSQKDEVFLLDVLRFGLRVRLEQEYKNRQ